MTVTLYHNPRCSKSRAALALLRERGLEPRIVEYLKTPPGLSELRRLQKSLGVPAREMMRTGEAAFGALGLDDPALDGEALLTALADCPALLQRPIAVAGDKAVIGRPPENVLRILG